MTEKCEIFACSSALSSIFEVACNNQDMICVYVEKYQNERKKMMIINFRQVYENSEIVLFIRVKKI